MTEQIKALELADAISKNKMTLSLECAAELRRLHAENESLKAMPMNYRRMKINAQLHAENDNLRAQRDRLLEALKALVEASDSDEWNGISTMKARTAIKSVEGE